MLSASKHYYPVSVEWTGELYYGFILDWYYKHKHDTLSIPGYADVAMNEYQQNNPTRPQHAPQKW